MFNDQALYEQIERVGADGAQSIADFCDVIAESDLPKRISLMVKFTDQVIADYEEENE